MIKDFIENKLVVKKMGILGALWLVILSIALELMIVIVPQLIGELLFRYNTAMAFSTYNFVVGAATKFTVAYILVNLYTKKRESLSSEEVNIEKQEDTEIQKPEITLKHRADNAVANKKALYINLGLMVVLFRMFYDNSLGYLVTWVFPIQQWLIDAFNQMTIIPVFGILSIVFIAPITEEILFRGIMLRGLLRKTSPKIAIFTSSFLFALIHLNFAQGINAFFLGLMASYVLYHTKSLKYAIYVHFINNGFVLAFGAISELVEEFTSEIVQYGIGTIFLLIFIYHIRVNLKRLFKEMATEEN